MNQAVPITTSEHHAEPVSGEQGPDPRLRVTVVFTSAEATLGALCTAGEFAKSLEAWIVLLAIEVVPFPLPLEKPSVAVDVLERPLLGLVSKSGIDADEVSIEICLCRDRWQCLRQLLKPHSLVVVGGKCGRWSRERKLQQRLRGLGHHVVFVDNGARSLVKSLPRSHRNLLRSLLEEREHTTGQCMQHPVINADGRRRTDTRKRNRLRSLYMQDLIFVTVTIAFFIVAMSYVHFCDRVK